MLPAELHRAICGHLDKMTGKPVNILKTESVGGGSINNAFKITSTAGQFFVKYNSNDRYPFMFQKEAKGLQLLREANEIKVPEVLFHDIDGKYSFLVLEWIDASAMKFDFWEDFGSSLASMHQHTQATFGLGFNNYMGSLEQSNKPHEDWISFFVEERLEPQVKLAHQSGEINSKAVNQFRQLYSSLPGILPVEKPALIHGDLWSGNFMTSGEGRACLVDPAVCYGHREADIAMTLLFGGFASTFYNGYQEAYPMKPGWQERMDIYNLYPLLIHVNLFGGGYARQVCNILNRFTGK